MNRLAIFIEDNTLYISTDNSNETYKNINSKLIFELLAKRFNGYDIIVQNLKQLKELKNYYEIDFERPLRLSYMEYSTLNTYFIKEIPLKDRLMFLNIDYPDNCTPSEQLLILYNNLEKLKFRFNKDVYHYIRALNEFKIRIKEESRTKCTFEYVMNNPLAYDDEYKRNIGTMASTVPDKLYSMILAHKISELYEVHFKGEKI